MSELATKRTPGPWIYQENSDAYTHIVRGPYNRFLAQLGQDTSGTAEANARLMAAAPELFNAVVAAREFIQKELDVVVDCNSVPDSEGNPTPGTLAPEAHSAVVQIKALLALIDNAVKKAEGAQ